MISFKVFDKKDDLSKEVAEIVFQHIKNNLSINLGLATGGTMEPVYAHLCQLINTQALDLSQVTTFNLDEYIGLDKTNSQSYYFYMQEHLFDKVSFNCTQTHLPLCSGDSEDFCRQYSQMIADAGGIDFQLLGIGENGHIGFNEPGTPFDQLTHVVELSEKTRKDNSRFFNSLDEVPSHAVTMGLQDIMNAKEVFLLATGKNKAEIIKQLAREEVSESLPASVLHRHSNVSIYLDQKAASLL